MHKQAKKAAQNSLLLNLKPSLSPTLHNRNERLRDG